MTTTVTLTISDGTRIDNVPYTANMTARNVLEAAYDLSVNPPTMPQISFWIDYYGYSLEYLVNMINGTTQMGDNYWFLYINGNVTTTGIDETIINPGDQVAFKYEAYNSSVHAQTVVGKIRSSAARR